MSSSFSLAGKQIVITGGSRGIGAELVRSAAVQGAKTIVVGYASNSQAAEELIAKLKQDEQTSKTNYHAVGANLIDQASSAKFIKDATAKLEGGKIDGLILCAGIMNMITLEQSNDENFNTHFDVNVRGSLFTIQAALPSIVNDGRIICFSTSVTMTPQALGPGYLQYTMAKAAVEQMVRVLQRDPSIGGPDRRITVNCIAPGATATELFFKGKSQEIVDRIASIMPEHRLGKPEEVAEATIFLLTPAASWVRGQLLRVNGAQTL